MSIKKTTKQHQCPHCDCDEFISEPNQYDVLRFRVGNFEISHTENINGEIKIFCRECGVKIDEEASELKREITPC